MAKPRGQLVDLNITTDYHLVSRCVRKAFLFGTDKDTGKNYDHRRQWVEDRLIEISRCFSVGLCAFAVMSNHTHVVIRVNEQQAKAWSDHEVIVRWNGVCPGNKSIKAYLTGNKLSAVQEQEIADSIEKWRERLYSVSWFMAKLNEHIARKANKEDECTGSFWEGRFKSYAILDHKSLLATMTYVDLNPIRAGVAKTPEASEHTSIKKRIDWALQYGNDHQPGDLLAFAGENPGEHINFELHDYLELVDWTGRLIRKDKQGAIDSELPPILKRLGFNADQWGKLTQGMGSYFKNFIGAPGILEETCSKQGRKRIHGMKASKALLST